MVEKTGITLLPSNATPLERHLEFVGSLSTNLATPLRDIWNPERAPDDILPYLAWGFSVDFWNYEWDADAKRGVIADMLYIHKHRGTLAAMKKVLLAAGYGDSKVIEAKDLVKLGTELPLGRLWRLGEQGVHWADYWVEVTEPINRVQADYLATILQAVQPARCRLRRVIVENIQFVIGRDVWTLGQDIPLGAAYEIGSEQWLMWQT